MTVEARRAALERKHKALEEELRLLGSQPSADPQAANELKREKLRVKDEMARLRA